MDMGPEGPYTVFQNAGQDVGGVWEMDPALGGRASWVAYATVPDVDAAAPASSTFFGRTGGIGEIHSSLRQTMDDRPWTMGIGRG